MLSVLMPATAVRRLSAAGKRDAIVSIYIAGRRSPSSIVLHTQSSSKPSLHHPPCVTPFGTRLLRWSFWACLGGALGCVRAEGAGVSTQARQATRPRCSSATRSRGSARGRAAPAWTLLPGYLPQGRAAQASAAARMAARRAKWGCCLGLGRSGRSAGALRGRPARTACPPCTAATAWPPTRACTHQVSGTFAPVTQEV